VLRLRAMSHPAVEGAAASRPAPPLRGWWVALGLLALGAAAVAAYAPALEGDFQFDDMASVAENPAIRDLGAFLAAASGRLSPISRLTTELTFALDYWSAGLDRTAFHRTSLVIHLLATLLLFLLGRALLRRAGAGGSGVALAAAALWALHPLQSQAVSYVAQRSEALAALLVAASLLLLLEGERRGRSVARWLLVAGATALFALALQAKLSAIALPALWLLVLLCFPSQVDAGARRPLGPIVPLLPLVAVAIPTALAALGSFRGLPDIGFSMARAPEGSYALTQLRALAHYLRLLLWPSGQSVDPAFAWSRSPLDPPSTLLAALLLAALATAAAWLLRLAARPGLSPEASATARTAAFGIGWFLLALAPSSSFVPVADAVAEHRAYLAAWGICLAAASAGAFLLRRTLSAQRAALAGTGATALLCAALALALRARNEVWRTPVTLWADAAEKASGRARPRFNLGFARAAAGDEEGAVREYLAARPLLGTDNVAPLPLLRNLGASLVALRRTDEALAVLSEAEVLEPRDPEIRNNLASAWLLKGDLDRAEAQARAAVALPGQPRAIGPAHNTLGQIRAGRGDLPGALASFRRAAELLPDHPGALGNVALVQQQLGLVAEACATWARVGELQGGVQRVQAARHRAALGCGPGR